VSFCVDTVRVGNLFGTDLIICLKHFLVVLRKKGIIHQNAYECQKDVGNFHFSVNVIDLRKSEEDFSVLFWVKLIITTIQLNPKCCHISRLKKVMIFHCHVTNPPIKCIFETIKTDRKFCEERHHFLKLVLIMFLTKLKIR